MIARAPSHESTKQHARHEARLALSVGGRFRFDRLRSNVDHAVGARP